MRLSNRVVRYVSGVMFALSIILVFAIGLVELRSAQEADTSRARTASQSVDDLLAGRRDALARTAFDYSAWDDTYSFVALFSEQYVDVNMTPEVVSNLGVNIFAIYDASGKLVRASGYDFAEERAADFDWAKHLITANPPLNLAGSDKGPVSGVVAVTGDQLMMVGAAPVLTSERKGPAVGTVVFGRLMDAAEVASVADSTHLDIAVTTDTSSDVLRPTLTLNPRALSGTTVVRRPLNSVGGMRVGTIAVTASREVFANALRSLAYLALCITIVCVGSTLMIYRGVHTIVIERIARLSGAIERVHDSGWVEPLGVGGDDELGTLSENVAAMVEALDQTRKEVEAARIASDSRYRLLIDNLAEAVFIIDRTGVIQFVSPGVVSILGFEPAALVGREFRSLLDNESGELLSGRIARGIPLAGTQLSLKVRAHEDILLDAEVALTPFDEETGDIQGILRDVTARRRYENELLHIASHDFLTGLANRRRFEEELGRELALAKRRGSRGAVLWLDLDNFKEVNDVLGHRAGDDMLVRVAGRLASSTRAESVLARLGGDEFAILLPGADAYEAEGAAARVLDEITDVALHVEGKVARASASLGVVLYPQHSTEVDELLSRADIAMYRAKEMGRSRFKVFEAGEHWRDDIEDRRTWVELVELALAQDGLLVFAQPITDTLTGQTVSYELLVRMTDLEGGIIPPDRFLPVAERVGLIVDIDLWVLGQAVRILASQPDGAFRLNVNVSTRTLNDPRFLTELEGIVLGSNIDPSRLVIEITETAIVVDVAGVQDTLRRIKALGCRIALDDFGSGFTSFLHLKQLPVDDIKIDGSFVQNLTENLNDQHLVRAMVEMARGLDVRTTAEFVESPEALDLLRAFGVEMAQGYHIARPGPADSMIEVEQLLARTLT